MRTHIVQALCLWQMCGLQIFYPSLSFASYSLKALSQSKSFEFEVQCIHLVSGLIQVEVIFALVFDPADFPKSFSFTFYIEVCEPFWVNFCIRVRFGLKLYVCVCMCVCLTCGRQSFRHYVYHLLKSLSFLHCIPFAHLSKSIGQVRVSQFLGSPFCSIDLPVYPTASVTWS